MTLSTASLVWLYGVVNGKEMRDLKDLRNGNATRGERSGNVKGEWKMQDSFLSER